MGEFRQSPQMIRRGAKQSWSWMHVPTQNVPSRRSAWKFLQKRSHAECSKPSNNPVMLRCIPHHHRTSHNPLHAVVGHGRRLKPCWWVEQAGASAKKVVLHLDWRGWGYSTELMLSSSARVNYESNLEVRFTPPVSNKNFGAALPSAAPMPRQIQRWQGNSKCPCRNWEWGWSWWMVMIGLDGEVGGWRCPLRRRS